MRSLSLKPLIEGVLGRRLSYPGVCTPKGNELLMRQIAVVWYMDPTM